MEASQLAAKVDAFLGGLGWKVTRLACHSISPEFPVENI